MNHTRTHIYIYIITAVVKYTSRAVNMTYLHNTFGNVEGSPSSCGVSVRRHSGVEREIDMREIFLDNFIYSSIKIR